MEQNKSPAFIELEKENEQLRGQLYITDIIRNGGESVRRKLQTERDKLKREVVELTQEINGGFNPKTGIRSQGWKALVGELKKRCEELHEGNTSIEGSL